MTLVQRALLFVMAVVGSSALAASAYAVQLGIVVKLDELYGSTSSGVWPLTALLSLFFAFPAFVLGAAAVGAFVWAGLMRPEALSRKSAAIVGALSTTLTGGLLFAAVFGLAGFLFAIPLPGAGAPGGLAFRRIVLNGLRILTPPPAPPA